MTTSGFRMDPEMITSHVQNLVYLWSKNYFYQEERMELPGGLSRLDDFLGAYRPLADQDFDVICNNS